ncbi:MAG TPA: DUF3039 domain-containing protein [Candidatus Stackebrandtia faecavium]|nr:DUF3039 domain-containing protein [Candidatus Stackebrandtia faecavium]
MTETFHGDGGTILDERTESDYRYDEGDEDKFAHYVPKDKLMDAMVSGKPIRALCGKLWVPSRDPERFPLCPRCQEIYETMKGGGDDSEE